LETTKGFFKTLLLLLRAAFQLVFQVFWQVFVIFHHFKFTKKSEKYFVLNLGLEYAVKKYGSGHIGLDCCQWSDLVWKTIKLVGKGVKVSNHFVLATQSKLEGEC